MWIPIVDAVTLFRAWLNSLNGHRPYPNSKLFGILDEDELTGCQGRAAPRVKGFVSCYSVALVRGPCVIVFQLPFPVKTQPHLKQTFHWLLFIQHNTQSVPSACSTDLPLFCKRLFLCVKSVIYLLVSKLCMNLFVRVCWMVRTRTTPRARCLTCRRSWSSQRPSWAEAASCSAWTRMTGSLRTNWPKQHETGTSFSQGKGLQT